MSLYWCNFNNSLEKTAIYWIKRDKSRSQLLQAYVFKEKKIVPAHLKE